MREACVSTRLPGGKKNSGNAATIQVSPRDTQSDKVEIPFVSSSLK